MPCVTCGAAGYQTGDTHLCIRHGGVPSAAVVAALVGGPGLSWPDGPAPVVEAPVEPEDDDGFELRPPRLLRALTWLLISVLATHVVLLAVGVWALSREDDVLRRYAADPGSVDRAAAADAFALVARAGDAVMVALWVTLLLFAVWFGLAGRVAERLGHDRRAVLRHWTYLGWRVALVPVVIYLFVEAARDEPAGADPAVFVAEALAVNHTAVLFAALRIVMLVLLAGFTGVVWRRLDRGYDPFLETY